MNINIDLNVNGTQEAALVQTVEAYKDAGYTDTTAESLLAGIMSIKEEALIDECLKYVNGPLEDKKYINECKASNLKALFDIERKENLEGATISTGFNSLDAIINGGLRKGLYFLGGISSIGKTTFIMQIADNIAKQKQDVLMFALEMSRVELMARSISRLTKIASEEDNCYKGEKEPSYWKYASSTNEVLYGNYRAGTQHKANEAYVEVAEQRYFEEIAPYMYIKEGVGNITIEDIVKTVETHIEKTGRKPVVIIDYLQIIAPIDIKMSDKQSIDKTVLELKRLSRDKGIPVIAISSLNRENYTKSLNMAAYKESGNIEYGADILIGLQYEGMDENTSDASEIIKSETAKGNAGKDVKIDVKILKNRNGIKRSVTLIYNPRYNEVRSEF